MLVSMLFCEKNHYEKRLNQFEKRLNQLKNDI